VQEINTVIMNNSPQMKIVPVKPETEPPLDELSEIAVVESVHMSLPLSSMLSSPKGHVFSPHQNRNTSEM
jgi:hypothetical protein